MKNIIGKNLAGKISLTSNIPFVIVMVLMGLISSQFLDNEIKNLAQRNRENTVNISVQLLESEIDSAARNYLRSVAEKNMQLLDYYYRLAADGAASEKDAFSRAREIFLDQEYGRIGTTGYLAGVSGNGILVIHPKSEGTDASGLDFMKKAIELKNGYLEYEWQNPGEEFPRKKAGYLSYFSPWDIMVWASSYKEEFNSLLDMNSIKNVVEKGRTGKNGFLLLLDSEGRVLAGEEAFSSHFPADADAASAIASLAEVVLEKERGDSFLDSASGLMAFSFAAMDEIGWHLAAFDFTSDYAGITKTFRMIIFLTIIISSLAVSYFVRLLMARLLSPIKAIQAVSSRVASGDLSGRINIRREDEIGELSLFFDKVIDSFADLVEKTRQASAVLIESTHSLGTGAQEVSSTANQQAASVKEILSTMEDSDKLSQGVALRIQEVVKIANNTKDSVDKGFGLIKESLGKMSEIKDTNANTINGIKTLGRQIETIWEIVNIINGIADQTKIIAFNAELEAAAAGEAGKNFQIVASEIRRLADGTVDSTNEIKSKINEIQHASDKLVISSEEGTQRIREGWDISHNIRKVFEDVLSSSEITASSAEDISRSIRMQVASFEQIFLTLKQISEGIDSFVLSTKSTSEASEQLKEIADNFSETFDHYKLRGEDGDE